MAISIHVLREEDDGEVGTAYTDRADFNPRPPRGGRLLDKTLAEVQDKISIHVLREEDDAKLSGLVSDNSHFNPRPPRGGRL